MSDPERPPSSVRIDNKAPNQGAQGIFNAPIFFGIGSLVDRDRVDRDRRNRKKMLERVHAFWINGLLEQSLHGTALIALEMEEQPDVVANPWRLVMQEVDRPPHMLPSGTRITQVYDDAKGELLILGEPGAGKTTLLLELARDLLARAEQDDTFPMPVVFNLSTWANKRQPITDWMVEELNQKYQVPRKVARSWVEADQVLPLLDGLDEVDRAYLAACIGALNAYRHEHGLVPTVVCSREVAYQGQSDRLLLHTAVVIHPLTPQQIDDYLSRPGEALEAVRTALRADPALQELAAVPLLLGVIAQVYHGNRVEDLPAHSSLELRRRQLFAAYVQRMFERRGATTNYTLEQTTHHLTWLARQLDRDNQVEFYVEQMQPYWLPSIGTHRLYRGITTVILAMLFFGAAGLLVGSTPGLGFGLVVGGLIGALNGALNLILRFTWRKTWSWLRLLVKCCCFGLVGGLAFALLTRLAVGQFHGQDLGSTNGPIFGVIAAVFGLLVDRLLGAPDMNIKLAEVVVWSWTRMAQSLVLFLCLGFAGGLIFALFFRYVHSWIAIIILGLCFGLILGLFFGLIRGWSSRTVENKDRTTPNQGIWRSARNGLRIGLRAGAGVGLIFGLFFGSIAIVDFAGNPRMLFGIDIVPDAGLTIPGWMEFAILLGLYYALSSGLFTGFVAGLFSGWDAWIKHFVLRFLLSRSGYLPWSLPSFLDYAAERIFLRKVGGGYIFVHRLLLEYFASLETVLTPDKSVEQVQEVSQPPF